MEILKMLFWISAGLVIYAYIVYPAILALMSRSYKLSTVHSSQPIGKALPSVSIITSAFNEEKVIRQKIENQLSLDYPKDKLEIIIVSDGSDDKTDEIVSEYENNGVVLLRLNDRIGKVNALNKAVPRAKGDIVLFSDANTVFEPDAVKRIVSGFGDKDVGCVCGELIFKNSTDDEVVRLEGFYWRYEQFLKRAEGARGSLLGANGGIYAIRKSLFKPLPSNTIVDDFVIAMRILGQGYKVIYEPMAIAYEETGKKVIQELERRIRIGAGDFQALLLTWKMLNPFQGFTAFAFFSHKVLRWFAPFLLILVFATNAMMIQNHLYMATFIAQCLFYSIAIIGRALSWLNVSIRVFSLPYYFVSMNLALFLGFIRFCFRAQSVMWRRTER